MSKKQTVTTELPPGLPLHAVEEIERDPSQLAWWAAWAAVGSAKDVMRENVKRLAAFEREWRHCVERAGGARPADPCECGTCPAVYLQLRDDIDAAKADVEAAIAVFKGS